MRTQYPMFKRNWMTSKLLDKKEVTTKASLFFWLCFKKSPYRRTCQVLQISGSCNCFLLHLHTLMDLPNFLPATCWKQSLLKDPFELPVLSTLELQIPLEDLGICVAQVPCHTSCLTHLNHNENTVVFMSTLELCKSSFYRKQNNFLISHNKKR